MKRSSSSARRGVVLVGDAERTLDLVDADDPLARNESVDGSAERRQLGAFGQLVGYRPQEGAVVEVRVRRLQLRAARSPFTLTITAPWATPISSAKEPGFTSFTTTP